MNPKISVVVAIHNFGPHLTECVTSLARQSLQPFEIILCDDGSTDDSPRNIQALSKRFPSIQSHRNEECKGPLSNIQWGLTKASGDLVCLVEEADRHHFNKLETEFAAMESWLDAGIAYSNVRDIDSNSRQTGLWDDNHGPKPPSGYILSRVFSRTLFPQKARLFRSPLIRRSLLEGALPFDESMESSANWDLMIRLAAQTAIVYTDTPLIDRRTTVSSVHEPTIEHRLISMLRVYEKNLERLQALPKAEREWTIRQTQKAIIEVRKSSGKQTLERLSPQDLMHTLESAN